MSTYLANRLNSVFPNRTYNDVEYDTLITLVCDTHGNYVKTVHQILYKSSKCPECVRLNKNKKLSTIGKTKVGKLNNFYGHHHTDKTRKKLSHPLSNETKQKISNTVKSQECQQRIRQTCKERYGSEIYVNADKMKLTKQQILYQYAKENYCTLVTDLIPEYGDSWRHIVDITTIYKAHAFVKNSDIDKIIKYRSSITPNAGMSRKEKDLVDYIKSFYTGPVLENRRKIIYPNELDIYLPDLKLAIEFNGNYWHSIENGCSKDYHLRKSVLCKAKGIRLIHIYEFEDILRQKELLKSLILGKDIYPKLDFNRNNFIMPIPKLYKNKTNKGTVYSVGPVIKEEIKNEYDQMVPNNCTNGK